MVLFSQMIQNVHNYLHFQRDVCCNAAPAIRRWKLQGIPLGQPKDVQKYVRHSGEGRTLEKGLGGNRRATESMDPSRRVVCSYGSGMI